MSTPGKPSGPVELSIGALSSATGVPVDTLRTWERRYGFPVPIGRTGGSHRRYAAESVEHVRLTVRALELGNRPAAVVGRDQDELRRLLGGLASRDAAPEEAAAAGPQRWLELARAMDGEALAAELQRGAAVAPALQFLEQRLGPFLTALGEEWARGSLRVSEEHYASERVREFLCARWREMSAGVPDGAALVVLATPPGERHSLGLHMAAWVLSLARARVLFLGADTPLDEVAFTAERHAADGVVLSVAAGYAGDLDGQLAQLSERLPRGVALVVGGAGAQTSNFEQVMGSFHQLARWGEQLRKRAQLLEYKE